MAQITRFEQLKVWQEAHKLVLMVYQATNCFPMEERFGMSSQMRRASVSIPANIAEGFKRYSNRDKLRFYNISEGSLEELKYYFILARDLQYIETDAPFMAQAELVGRLLHGLMASIPLRR